MKKKTRVAGLFIALLGLAGYVAMPSAMAAPCPGGADNAVPAILLLGRHQIYWLEPRPICIDLSGPATQQTFKVRVAGRGSGYKTAHGPIRIAEKQSSDDLPTIRGDNSDNAYEFTVTVKEAKNNPGQQSEDYAFWVDVPRLGKLDPMVRIIRQGGSARKLQYNDLLEVLEELDIEPADVPELLREFGSIESE